MTAASVSHRGPEESMMSAIEILLVEDNPDDLALVLRVLRRQDLAHRVEVVQDGAEALDFLFCTGAYAHHRLEDRPRVILLDLKLSKVTGLEVLQRLLAWPQPDRPGLEERSGHRPHYASRVALAAWATPVPTAAGASECFPRHGSCAGLPSG
jgi:CheY-like chemotaxis protein